MQVLFISLFDAPVFFAFSAAMQFFVIFFLSAVVVLPPDLSIPVTCCWCGEDADTGLLPCVAGASVAWLEVASRWLGLEAALGAVESGGETVCALESEAEPTAISPIKVIKGFMDVILIALGFRQSLT